VPVQHAALGAADDSIVEAVRVALEGARRPLIVVGPGPLADQATAGAIGKLARQSGWPLWCESTSQLRFSEAAREVLCFDAFDWVLRAGANRAGPDCVLQFGDPPTSGAWVKWLESTREISLVVVHPSAWADPSQRARLVVNASVAELARSLEARLDPVSADWRERVRAANGAAWQCVQEYLRDAASSQAAPSSSALFDEAQAFDVVGRQMQDGDLLSLGNSLPVRLADAVWRQRSTALRCLSQRGANGIDGCISSAAGAASLHDGFTLGVIGDVSALHDVWGRGCDSPSAKRDAPASGRGTCRRSRR
jgi:2-succinyl-5-enolpyruvyl-6-hydroxy-3-cyclohexene-1-carboxylate synthase